MEDAGFMREWLIMAAALLPCRAAIVSSRMLPLADYESLTTMSFSAAVSGEAVGQGGASVLDSVSLLASESE